MIDGIFLNFVLIFLQQKKELPVGSSFIDIHRVYFAPLIEACAAANRAIGTRKGEQLT
jgi:hypothetical protein